MRNLFCACRNGDLHRRSTGTFLAPSPCFQSVFLHFLSIVLSITLLAKTKGLLSSCFQRELQLTLLLQGRLSCSVLLSFAEAHAEKEETNVVQEDRNFALEAIAGRLEAIV